MTRNEMIERLEKSGFTADEIESLLATYEAEGRKFDEEE